MSGKLIVFEGTDGSGKATQAKLLCETLAQRGIAYREIDFPRYGNPFAEPANLYLHGALGNRPGDVNAYAASVLYAVDRFASYKEDWGGFYEEGGIVVANRYTTSNAVHQASRKGSGRHFWTGSSTWNTAAWACPRRTWCCTWICPQMCLRRCSGIGSRRPPPLRTFTSRTGLISAAAGRAPARLRGIWAGR